jgi:hypothetical protein
MLEIRSAADADRIMNTHHREIVKRGQQSIDDIYANYKPENKPFSVYIEEKDDITKGVPNLNDSEMGLLCMGTVQEGAPAEPGWCWESVWFFEDVNMYSILILMNDDFGVEYFVPNYPTLNPILKLALEKHSEPHEDHQEES